MFAPSGPTLWARGLLISLAAAAHQGWSANIFTFSSDMFPRRAVGSVVGFGGMAGAVGGMLIAMITGYDAASGPGATLPVFIIAASAYLLALGMHPAAGAENPAWSEAETRAESAIHEDRRRPRHRLFARDGTSSR